MNLRGSDAEKLLQNLKEAYPTWDDLKHMVRFKLDEGLESITEKGNTRSVIFNLIEWAEANWRLEDLLRGVCEDNPNNSELQKIYQQHFPFSRQTKVVSSEQWDKLLLILSEIDLDILEEICRKTLESISNNIEEHVPKIVNLKNVSLLKEILLEQYPSKGGIPTILEFIERLSNCEEISKSCRIRLKENLQKIAEEKKIKLPTYTDESSVSISFNSYLLILIEENPEVFDRFTVRAEFIPNYREGETEFHSESLYLDEDSLSCPLEEIKIIIYEFVKAAKIKLQGKCKDYILTIELFLPTSYLGYRFDLKEIPAGRKKFKPIGYQYQLTTRCLERYLVNDDTNYGEFLNIFNQKWKCFQKYLNARRHREKSGDICLYLEADEIEQWDEFAIATEWDRSQKLAVGATGNLAREECQQKFFECLLRGGIILSLWHYCPRLNCDRVKKEFQEILSSDRLQSWNELFREVLEVRKQAHDKKQPNKLGYHLGFLCEHGFRIPSILDIDGGGDSLM